MRHRSPSRRCWFITGLRQVQKWITALSHMCPDTHLHANGSKCVDTHTHSMPEWACMHSRRAPVAHNPPLTCGQRYPLFFCVCEPVCVFTPTFPTRLSSHAASLLSSTPDALLIDFLFLWVVAHVTFPAGAHTLRLSTASHPGNQKYRKFCGGVSCTERQCLSHRVTHLHGFHIARLPIRALTGRR